MQPPPAPEDNASRPQWSPTLKFIVGVMLVIAFVAMIALFRAVLYPLIVGTIIAFLMYPLVQRVHQNSRLPHALATSLLYILVMAAIILIGIAVAPLIVDTLRYLRDELISLADWLSRLSPNEMVIILGFELPTQDLAAEVTSTLIEFLRSLASEPFELVFGVAETVLLGVFTLLIGFYLTRDAHKILDWLAGLVPPRYGRDVSLLLSEINQVWAAFFRGQFVLALVVTVIITVVGTLLGLPQPVLLGIFAGFLEFLPSVGHAIWIVTAMTIALIEGSTTLRVSNFVFALIIAGAHFLFTQFDLNFLIPTIIGREVRLHPMVVIIGIIIGATVGGVLGVALAAPTIATARILARYVYAMLFDLDPFPMVGPPSAPKAERLATAEQLAARPRPRPPTLRRGGRRRAGAGGETAEPFE